MQEEVQTGCCLFPWLTCYVQAFSNPLVLSYKLLFPWEHKQWERKVVFVFPLFCFGFYKSPMVNTFPWNLNELKANSFRQAHKLKWMLLMNILLLRNKCTEVYISSFSMDCWSDWIWGLSWEPSLMVTAVAMTGLDTPHARPRACLERTNTYGTF